MWRQRVTGFLRTWRQIPHFLPDMGDPENTTVFWVFFLGAHICGDGKTFPAVRGISHFLG